jgi:hypothetical protein
MGQWGRPVELLMLFAGRRPDLRLEFLPGLVDYGFEASHQRAGMEE